MCKTIEGNKHNIQIPCVGKKSIYWQTFCCLIQFILKRCIMVFYMHAF